MKVKKDWSRNRLLTESQIPERLIKSLESGLRDMFQKELASARQEAKPVRKIRTRDLFIISLEVIGIMANFVL